MPPAASQSPLIYTRKHFIVFVAIDEIIIFLSGSGDDDELSLAETLRGLIVNLQHATKKGKLTESAVIEYYPKICLRVDSIISNGVVNTLDPALIEQYVKLSAEKKK